MTHSGSIQAWGTLFSFLLSLCIFVGFNYDDIYQFLLARLNGQELDSQIFSQLRLSLVQSLLFLVVSLFLTWVLSSLSKIESNIQTVAIKLIGDLPQKTGNAVRAAATAINDELLTLRSELANGVVRSQGTLYRSLRYSEDTGILYNHTSKDENAPRNVLFNNQTIAVLLSTATDTSFEKLSKIGYECGRRFGVFLQNKLRENSNMRLSLRKVIDIWIEYDSNAGFGKFDLEVSDDEKAMHILLKHNFLAEMAEFQEPSRSLCPFMTGYLNGVLSTLPREIIKESGFQSGRLGVVHDVCSENCVCTSHDQHRGCRWELVQL